MSGDVTAAAWVFGLLAGGGVFFGLASIGGGIERGLNNISRALHHKVEHEHPDEHRAPMEHDR